MTNAERLEAIEEMVNGLLDTMDDSQPGSVPKSLPVILASVRDIAAERHEDQREHVRPPAISYATAYTMPRILIESQTRHGTYAVELANDTIVPFSKSDPGPDGWIKLLDAAGVTVAEVNLRHIARICPSPASIK